MGYYTAQYNISSWALKKIYMQMDVAESGESAGWYWVIVENNKQISDVDYSVFYLPTTEESSVPTGQQDWSIGFKGIIGEQNFENPEFQ